MNLIKKQIAYSNKVNPQGEIAFAWANFLKYTVDREAYIEWARTPDHRLLADDLWPEKRSWWKVIRDNIMGCIP